jgi:hypothetical protein
MTTLTLTTQPQFGYNRLTITPTEDITAVRRADANGTYDVRTLDGLLPWPVASGVLVLEDYEANGAATYTVTTAAGNVAGAIVLALTSPWLGTPEAPQFSAAVASVLDYSAGTTTLSTVHEPEGRHDPIVIVRGASSRRGSLTIEGGNYATALDLLRLCQRGQTMFLRQLDHPGMDMFFVPMQSDISPALAAGPASLFDLRIQYIEVARPAGALSGALGWDWDGLEAAFPTWDAVFDAYASWGDVRTDVRKP